MITITGEPKEIAALVVALQERRVDVYFRKKNFKDTSHRYLWADRESYQMRIFGRAHSLGEIQRKTQKNYPGYVVNLVRF